MSYAAEWTSDAEEDYQRIVGIDPVMASLLLDKIDELCADPKRLSRPASFPHLLFPKYEFNAEDADGGQHRLTILFEIDEGRRVVVLRYIGHVEYGYD